jgi:hypothetical protein
VDPEGIVMSLIGLGRIAAQRLDHTTAGLRCQEALKLARDRQDGRWTGDALFLSGELKEGQGAAWSAWIDYEAALRLFVEANCAEQAERTQERLARLRQDGSVQPCRV